MSQVQGTVERIHTRDTANGGTAYNLVVGGEWYGNGFEAPQCNEGDTIEFTFKQNGNFKNINKGSLRIATAVASVDTGTGNNSKTVVKPNTRDLSIGYQSSRKDAIAVVTAMIGSGVAPVPKDAKKGYTATLALINELTNQYYTELQTVIENGGVEEVQQAPEPSAF